jgi:hypothetical protein
MNPDLERLILAFDAYTQARDLEAARLETEYQILLDAVLAANPGLSSESLHQTIRLAHLRWFRAQGKIPPTLPPKA